MSSAVRAGIDRYTLISDLAGGARRLVAYVVMPVLVITLVMSVYLAISGHPGAWGLAPMGIGAAFALQVWKGRGLSVPLLPLLVLQHLVIYGLPIAVGNESTLQYPASLIQEAGLELLAFFVALAAGWHFSMQVFTPSAPVAHALKIITLEGHHSLRRIGYLLIGASTAYYLLQSLDLVAALLAVLPGGSESLLTALTSVIAVSGFFLIALDLGSGHATPFNIGLYWSLFILNCLLSASGLLLSPTTGVIAATAIGLFWSSQRVPWKFLLVVLSLLQFFSLGKYEMRQRYWEESDEFIPSVALWDMPQRYVEWADASVNALLPAPAGRPRRVAATETGSVFGRIDNLQNLLYVMDDVKTRHTSLLHGATYTLIPPLLIPRLFWPDKPRTHEGQVMLNIHFGRQDLLSSFRAYIAWGLLPEAYGNFGPWLGALFLGLVLGGLCAAFEKYFAPKLVISLEGFIAFTIVLGMAASFEMVASVLVTSLFQAVIVVIAACLPFVHKASTKPAGSRPPR